MMYNKIVQDCFFEPRHIGSIVDSASLVAHLRGVQKAQGVVIDLFLQCSADGFVIRSCFKANGNPYVIAALEWVCRQIEGQHIDVLQASYYQHLISELGIPVNQSPVALQIDGVYQEVLVLMRDKLRGQS